MVLENHIALRVGLWEKIKTLINYSQVLARYQTLNLMIHID